MNEIRNIISDILSRALPASEIPGFFGFLFKQVAIVSLIFIFASIFIFIVTR